MIWLTKELKSDIKRVFEPRYKRILLESEVLELAENLTSGLEGISRFKWRQYEKITG